MKQKNQEKILYTAGIIAGAALIVLTKKVAIPSEDTTYAFWAGLLILSFSIIGFVFAEEIDLELDEVNKKLILNKKNIFGTKILSFSFFDIDKLFIKTQRRKNLEVYHLLIHLKNGTKIKTGRWSFQQDELISEAQDFCQKINCQLDQSTHFYALNTKRILLAFGGSVLIYMIFYKATVGPFCPAMWYGTAPIMIITTSFIFLISILRRTEV